jgi:hypothetical protein
MSIRVRRSKNGVPLGAPETGGIQDDLTYETTFDGMTFAWGPGQIRNFADDAVGLGHATFFGSASVVRETGLFATNGQSRA